MSGTVRVASWVIVGGLGVLMAATEADGAADPSSFEEVAKQAAAAPELETLVAPYLDDCAKARREIDRARCRGMQSFVNDKLPNRIYSTVVDSPNVVSVSGYEAGIKGFRVRLIGCLTCEKPVLGPDAQKRFVTLRVPDKHAQTFGTASVLGDTTVSFDSVPEARAWEAQVKPLLRAEVIFKPAGKSWTYRDYKGLAFAPLATRIFNRCTGEVIFSSPRSMANVSVPEDAEGCKSSPSSETIGKSDKEGRQKEGLDNRPEKLGVGEIAQALKPVNAELRACDTRFKTRGSVDLEFEVQGNGGAAQAVRARGNLGGTDVATCLLEAVRKVQFPQFQRASQKFSFSVRLHGE
jgi:hypothetical protein